MHFFTWFNPGEAHITRTIALEHIVCIKWQELPVGAQGETVAEVTLSTGHGTIKVIGTHNLREFRRCLRRNGKDFMVGVD